MNPTAPRLDAADAEYWKTRYEQERERLVKLWVAYKALETETEARAEGPSA